MKTKTVSLCLMCCVLYSYGCNRNSLTPIVNNDIKRIEFYYTLNSIPKDWEEIKRFRIENKDDISQIVSALKKATSNDTLLDSSIKMKFIFEDGKDIWVDYEIDRREQAVYGEDWVSGELYDIFVKRGIIKPLKESPLPILQN